MKECNDCKIKVYESNNICPLCGRKLGDNVEESVVTYPINEYIKEQKGNYIEKTLLFLSITAIIISIFINIFTYPLTLNFWSINVVVGLVFLWFIFKVIKSQNINLGGKILKIYSAVAVLLFMIDIGNGFLKWSTTYVIPFLTMALAIIFTMIAITVRYNFREYFGYLLAVMLISVLPIFLYIVKLSKVLWISFVASLTCSIIAVGIYIYADQALKDEIKKRFHT